MCCTVLMYEVCVLKTIFICAGAAKVGVIELIYVYRRRRPTVEINYIRRLLVSFNVTYYWLWFMYFYKLALFSEEVSSSSYIETLQQLFNTLEKRRLSIFVEYASYCILTLERKKSPLKNQLNYNTNRLYKAKY